MTPTTDNDDDADSEILLVLHNKRSIDPKVLQKANIDDCTADGASDEALITVTHNGQVEAKEMFVAAGEKETQIVSNKSKKKKKMKSEG
eukprot:scaffold798_cov79-Cylindrotheca_fusiformis.AAC.2